MLKNFEMEALEETINSLFVYLEPWLAYTISNGASFEAGMNDEK